MSKSRSRSHHEAMQQIQLLDTFLKPVHFSYSNTRQKTQQSQQPSREVTRRPDINLNPYTPAQPMLEPIQVRYHETLPLKQPTPKPAFKDKEISEIAELLAEQNRKLKLTIKEKKQQEFTARFQKEVDEIKGRLNSIDGQFANYAKLEDLYLLKSEVQELRAASRTDKQQFQQQQHYPQFPPINPYTPYMPMYNPYQMPFGFQPQFQQQLNNTEPQQSPKPMPFSKPQTQQNQNSHSKPQTQQNEPKPASQARSTVPQSKPTSQQGQLQTKPQTSNKPNSKPPTRPTSQKQSNPTARARLSKIFQTVKAAMRWMIYCRYSNMMWRKLSAHLNHCRQQIQKLTQKVTMDRINAWSLMVVGKFATFLQTAKDLDFVVLHYVKQNKKLSQQELDQGHIQLTTAIKYILSTLETYVTKDLCIPELKLISYVQFFDEPEIERGLFVAKRVLFWKEKQLDMTQTQQMMIVTELVLLVHIIPTLLSVKGSPFLRKAVATILQAHFMRYFDLRILNRFPELQIVYIEVSPELLQTLKSLENQQEERFIVGLFDESQFAEFYEKRPKLEDEIQKSIAVISESLLKTLMS